jgi:hypothetical protein
VRGLDTPAPLVHYKKTNPHHDSHGERMSDTGKKKLGVIVDTVRENDDTTSIFFRPKMTNASRHSDPDNSHPYG